jgi:hypothetical protein
MSEQTEQVTIILEHAKVTAMIHDGILADSGLSSAEIVRLVESIDSIYQKREKELLQTYVAPKDVQKFLADERSTAFEDVGGLIQKLQEFYKGSKAELTVITRIKEDFSKLRNKQG